MEENIFDEYDIVDEKSITDITFDIHINGTNRILDASSAFCDRTSFNKLVFKTVRGDYPRKKLQIKDVGGSVSESKNAQQPLAQIIRCIRKHEIEKKITLNKGGSAEVDAGDDWSYDDCSIVLRILKKREHIENPCPPLSSPDDDLTVHIDDRQVTVSAHWLMAVSPVVHRMLSVEMKEKQQRSLNLDGLDINMEQFNGFLEAISIKGLHTPILPNPQNVLSLLKLADYFQVDWLKERCDTHLINCLEIPLIDRFFLVEPYQLTKLKQFFLRFASSEASSCPRFLCELFQRLFEKK
uniref:BTB domain-containing protein n=1 Tax=Globodera rostochiensis TaxID=31243 RepID=A0A914H0R6_GLORO